MSDTSLAGDITVGAAETDGVRFLARAAEEGLGYALCFDGILNVSGNSELCFRPLEPEVTQTMCIIWKKYQVLTKAAEKFLLQMKAMTK